MEIEYVKFPDGIRTNQDATVQEFGKHVNAITHELNKLHPELNLPENPINTNFFGGDRSDPFTWGISIAGINGYSAKKAMQVFEEAAQKQPEDSALRKTLSSLSRASFDLCVADRNLPLVFDAQGTSYDYKLTTDALIGTKISLQSAYRHLHSTDDRPETQP